MLNHGRKLRVLLLLIAVCSVFLITYQGDVVWFSDRGTRFPNYMPAHIEGSNTDMNLDEAFNPQNKKSKLGRVLKSFGNDKESSQLQKKQRMLLCGSTWQEEYMKLHDDILNNRRPPKYLVYFCGGKKYGCGGYGNRLGAITSLFYLAVITGRAFLIDWKSTVPIAEYLQPKNIQWNFPISKLHHLKANYHYWGKGDHQLVNRDSQRSSDKFSLFRDWLEGTDLEKYLDSPVEVVTSLWYFAPSFRQHKFAERLANMLGVKAKGHRYSLVGCAFDFLFQRTPGFDKTLSAARESLHLNTNVPRIGIHIRMGDASSFSQGSLDQRTSDFSNFFTCAKKLESAIIQSDKNASRADIKWFLATDNSEVKQHALRTYPNKVVSLAVKVEHINFREPSMEGMTGVLLDHTLLSECDFLVLSDSSFSKTALGMNFHSLEHSTFGDKCRYVT